MNKNFPAYVLLIVALTLWLWAVASLRLTTFEDGSMSLTIFGQQMGAACPDWFAPLQCSN